MGQSSTKLPEEHEVVEPTSAFMHDEIMRPHEPAPLPEMYPTSAEMHDKEREFVARVAGASHNLSALCETVRERRRLACREEREALADCIRGGDLLACSSLIRALETCSGSEKQ